MTITMSMRLLIDLNITLSVAAAEVAVVVLVAVAVPICIRFGFGVASRVFWQRTEKASQRYDFLWLGLWMAMDGCSQRAEWESRGDGGGTCPVVSTMLHLGSWGRSRTKHTGRK